MSNPTVVAEYVVQLLSDGTFRHVGLTADVPRAMGEMTRAVETVKDAMPGAEVMPEGTPAEPQSDSERLGNTIRAARSHEDLTALWSAHKAVWTAEHSKLATARKKQLG